MDTEEAALALELSEHSVRQYCRRGAFKARKFGRAWMIEREDLKRYIEDRKMGRPKKAATRPGKGGRPPKSAKKPEGD